MLLTLVVWCLCKICGYSLGYSFATGFCRVSAFCRLVVIWLVFLCYVKSGATSEWQSTSHITFSAKSKQSCYVRDAVVLRTVACEKWPSIFTDQVRGDTSICGSFNTASWNSKAAAAGAEWTGCWWTNVSSVMNDYFEQWLMWFCYDIAYGPKHCIALC